MPDEEIRRWLEHDRHHLLKPGDAFYPDCLAGVHDPPPLLYVDGDPGCLDDALPRVAMVGARKASSYGMRQARNMAEDLAAAGIVVVSGLALGIDSAAHEGALASGRTIAVLGTGINRIYPKRNWRLAERIRDQGGLIVSEFPLGTEGRPWNFPRRNRIVTGLSLATVVVEAATRSGSLISAELAISQGRDVMAVPGPVSNQQARGCHQLIREGAALVENAGDVLRELGLASEAAAVVPSKPRLSGGQLKLYECLAAGPLTMDMLCESADLPVDELTVSLVSLEIAGLVTCDAGVYCRRETGGTS